MTSIMPTSHKTTKLQNSLMREEYRKPVKYILFWNKKEEYTSFFNCRNEKSCFATHQRDLMPLTGYDAIIFYSEEITNWTEPVQRSPKQKYIYYVTGKPMKENICKNDFYNWTISYKKESDIRIQHYLVKKQKTNYSFNHKIFERKTKFAASLLSNCSKKKPSIRNKYLSELQKYIEIENYGKCGKLKCDTSAVECYKMLAKNYKFYLFFEDQICKDYSEPELFEILQFDIVPVVLGGANYTEITPPYSVINTMDFETPDKLVQYLQYILIEQEEYLKYFEWKKNYIIKKNEPVLCKLCEMLHKPIVYSHYPEMVEWVNGNNRSCFLPWNTKNKLSTFHMLGFCQINII